MMRLLTGDVRDVLPTLADASVQTVITSPPYYALRSYLDASHPDKHREIGSEATPDAYIATMVGVFRELRRVLRDDGTCWVNMGDSYSDGGSGANKRQRNQPNENRNGTADTKAQRGVLATTSDGAKPKDLLMMPARLAIALQQDGWWLRSDIIWAKPNPMPESVTDRPTRSHEYVFLLTKAARYYYDQQGIAEPLDRPEEADRRTPAKFGGADKFPEALKQSRLHSGNEYRGTPTGTRNARSVWNIATHSFPAAHFATFPPELAERCIRAGSRPGDTILDPFSGAGTALLVADRLGRDAIGIDLSHAYVEMARERLTADCPLFADITDTPVPVHPVAEIADLFAEAAE